MTDGADAGQAGAEQAGAAASGASPSRAPRRARGVMESLLTIVHWLEALAMLFAILAVWGVTRDWPVPTVFAVVTVLLVLTTRVLRYRWGWGVSLVMQAVLLSLGAFEPVMIGVGVVFVAMWVFCFVRARQIETAKARFDRANPQKETS